MTLPSDSELKDIVHRVVQRTLTGSKAGEVSSPSRSGGSARGPAPTAPEAVESKPTGAGQTIALGADHGGFALKQTLGAYLSQQGYNVIDCGTYSTESVDYPDFAFAVARLVSQGKAWRGIIVDGAGIGSCMVANKVPGIRAALCYDQATATNSREHNNANVLTLGARMISENSARQIVNIWLTTLFGGDRHARRVEKIMAIERQFLKNTD